jgi:ADP-ribose pyrophosphatase YjhB (NUDIX family)
VPAKPKRPAGSHHLTFTLSRVSHGKVLEGVWRELGVRLSTPGVLAIVQEKGAAQYELSCVGGKRDAGETSLEAAVREAAEETGGFVRLDDGAQFRRVAALDCHDEAMAFWGFCYVGGLEGVAPLNSLKESVAPGAPPTPPRRLRPEAATFVPASSRQPPPPPELGLSEVRKRESVSKGSGRRRTSKASSGKGGLTDAVVVEAGGGGDKPPARRRKASKSSSVEVEHTT